MTKATLKQCAAALYKHGGIVMKAAAELGIDRSTLAERISKNPTLQKVKAEVEEILKDKAEGNIHEALEAGDITTSRWYVQQKAKDRGYGAVSVDDDQLNRLVGAMSPEALKKLAEG